MISAHELHAAHMQLHPHLVCAPHLYEDYLKSHSLVAESSDIKYVDNLFSDWLLSTDQCEKGFEEEL